MKILESAVAILRRLLTLPGAAPKHGGAETAEALTRFFLAHEQGDSNCLPPDRDDLLNEIYLNLLLTCDQCGRMEEFEDVSREAAPGQDWAWPYSQRAVVKARWDGWTVECDPERGPVFCCGACQTSLPQSPAP